MAVYCMFFELIGDHRDLHVLTHSFPTRLSSDLALVRRARTSSWNLRAPRCPRTRCGTPTNASRSRARRVCSTRRSEEHTSELLHSCASRMLSSSCKNKHHFYYYISINIFMTGLHPHPLHTHTTTVNIHYT